MAHKSKNHRKDAEVSTPGSVVEQTSSESTQKESRKVSQPEAGHQESGITWQPIFVIVAITIGIFIVLAKVLGLF